MCGIESNLCPIEMLADSFVSHSLNWNRYCNVAVLIISFPNPCPRGRPPPPPHHLELPTPPNHTDKWLVGTVGRPHTRAHFQVYSYMFSDSLVFPRPMQGKLLLARKGNSQRVFRNFKPFRTKPAQVAGVW